MLMTRYAKIEEMSGVLVHFIPTSKFSADCIGMLDRHIWRYSDLIAHIGLMSWLTQLVGVHIVEYNKFEQIPNLKFDNTFGDKLYYFKKHIKSKFNRLDSQLVV